MRVLELAFPPTSEPAASSKLLRFDRERFHRGRNRLDLFDFPENELLVAAGKRKKRSKQFAFFL